jgi:hypothetical protein
MRLRKKEIHDQSERPHIRTMNALLALSVFDGPAIPCRPKDSSHNTNAVSRTIPAVYRYPRVVSRTSLGRIANETSSNCTEAALAAGMAVAPCTNCPLESGGLTTTLDNRYQVKSPDPTGSTTNGTAICSAPLKPYGPFGPSCRGHEEAETRNQPHCPHVRTQLRPGLIDVPSTLLAIGDAMLE